MAKVLWTQKQDIGPLPRAGHAMAFDTTRRRVVLFGGTTLAGTFFADTWEWDGDSWTQMQDIGPTPRAFHAMTFDSARNRAVLFGGSAEAGALADTWEWDGEFWTQVADSGPAPRSRHAMAFHSQRQRSVLFGGQSDPQPARFNDTWEWDGDEWVQQADSGPSPRVNAAMAFDTARNRLVLFGGANVDRGLRDTWEWDGAAWTEEADFGPDACAAAAMVFKGSRVTLFGGVASLANTQAPPAVFGRTWEWDGSHWTARQDMGPGPRAFHAMAFDATRSRVVLFGGIAASQVGAAPPDVHGDTWEQFDSGPASTPPSSTPPSSVPTPTPPVPVPGPSSVSLSAVPNPAKPGSAVTINVTVDMGIPMPWPVDLFLNGQPLGTVQIPANTRNGTFQLQIPAGQTAGPVTIRAQERVGLTETSIVLTIQP
jgi:N-acetylneuraminic acid mutarotase